MTNEPMVPTRTLAAIIAHKVPTATPEEFIRYGYTAKGAPIYLHKPTGKRYVANGTLPGRKIPPATYTLCGPQSAQYRQAGNGVCPQVSEAIARGLMASQAKEA